MLVVSRKVFERFRVMVNGVEVWVTVCDIDRNKVRLAVTAPRECAVHREELLDPAERYNARAREGVSP